MDSKEFEKRFGSKANMANLRGRAIKSGTVTMVGQALRFAIQTGATMILARLLLPESFGLVVMTQSILVFVNVFQSFGLSIATVQQQEITHQQTSTLFWLNVAAGVGAATVTLAIAPLVSMLYGDPRLTQICVALSVPMLIGGLSAQHGALLHRQMRFSTQQSIQIIAMLLGVLVAVISAMNGLDYWSLVVQEIVVASAIATGLWLSVRWKPGRPRRGIGSRKMVSFGAHITGTSIVNLLSRNLSNVIIGNLAGAASLGQYSKAFSLLMLPIRQINAPLRNVAIPTLSRLQNDPPRFQRYYSQGIELLLFAGAPIVAYSYYAADQIILIMLGENWNETAPLFRALAPAAITGILGISISWLYIPLGRAKQQFYANLAGSSIVIGALFVGARWGALGIAHALSIVSIAKYLPELAYCTRGSPLSITIVLRSIARPLLAAASSCLALTVLLPPAALSHSLILQVAGSASAFTALYLFLNLILPGGPQFYKSAKSTLSSILSRG